MKLTWNRQRTYAALIGIGIWALLFRTIAMLTDGSLGILMPWAAGLLFMEFALNISTFVTAIWWCGAGTERRAWLPLRFAAAAVLLHAIRVAIYVLGRSGPWKDFDWRPEHRGITPPEWSWVVLAAVLAVLGLIGVTIVWRVRRRHRE
jgi:hypothetical protein